MIRTSLFIYLMRNNYFLQCKKKILKFFMRIVTENNKIRIIWMKSNPSFLSYNFERSDKVQFLHLFFIFLIEYILIYLPIIIYFLSLFLSFFLSIFLSSYLSIYLSFFFSIYLSFFLSFSLYFFLSFFLSFYLFFSVGLTAVCDIIQKKLFI